MIIASVLENKEIEKRIAITPEIAKKYISLGFDVFLSQNYGHHLGINDAEYEVKKLPDGSNGNIDVIIKRDEQRFKKFSFFFIYVFKPLVIK